jgi:general secretion pathway protein J
MAHFPGSPPEWLSASPRTPPLARASRADGFTLLELLVAIMVLTLLMTAGFGALRLGGRSYETGVERSASSETTRSVADFLRRQFAQIVPVAADDGDTPRFAFEGDDTHVRFVAPAPRHPDAGGLLVYTLGIEATGRSQRLVLSYALFDPGRPDDLLHTPVTDTQYKLILAEGLETASFQYYGLSSRRPTQPGWQDTWPPDEEGLPELVRMTLTDPHQVNGWPDMIFKVRSETRS